jgi:hypothetical protein
MSLAAVSTALMCTALLCVFAMWWPVLKRLEVAAAAAAAAARSGPPTIEISFGPLKAETASVPICPYAADPPTTTNALPALRRWRERVLGLTTRVRRASAASIAAITPQARTATKAKPKKKIKTVPPPRPRAPRPIKGAPSDDAPTAMWIVAPELDFVVQRPQW